MSVVNPTSIPRVIARDLTKLPIGAIEGFVLSRIDGATSVSEVASVTGLPPDDVSAILIKLADLAAIELPGYTPKTASSTPPRIAEANAAAPNAPAAGRPSPTPAAQPIDVSSIPDDHPDLREASELGLELRKEILALHDELDNRDYYALLGVPRTADRKQLKSAYYGLASKFHTDRHFGKNLGVFKLKMEQIFGRLTLAHDTLTAALRREEYDQYLATQEQTLAYERLIEGYDVDAEPAEERPLREDVVRRIGSESRVQAVTEPSTSTSSSSSTADTTQAPPPVAPRAPSSSATMAAVNPAEQERIRREALARRLGGSSRRMAAAPKPPTVVTTSTSTESPADAARKLSGFLRRPSDDLVLAAKRAHVQKLVDAAKEAAAKNDYLGAANNYRLALQHVEDPAIEAAAADATQKARKSMVDVYLKQARWEESDKKWGMAALSYLKALAGKPDDPDLSERAANALRMEGRDLHRAARLAEAAVAKNPKKALYRTTLGNVYLDAGLFLRARTELENAARLAPNDAHVRELLARARKAAS